MVRPSERSYGTIFGVELPPFAILPKRPPSLENRGLALVSSNVARSGPLATDDLRGVLREDSLLGYAPREGAASANGLWSFDRGIDGSHYGPRTNAIIAERLAHDRPSSSVRDGASESRAPTGCIRLRRTGHVGGVEGARGVANRP
jgi:hypothetical protein